MEKKSQGHCARCLSAKQRFLAIGLLLISFLCSVWYLGLTFQDYNRYELYPLFSNHEGTGAYKLDKHTGEVTAYYNLWEFKTTPVEGDKQTAGWSWLQRMETKTPLLYTEQYLQ